MKGEGRDGGPHATLFLSCPEVEDARRFLPKSLGEAELLSGNLSAHPLGLQGS